MTAKTTKILLASALVAFCVTCGVTYQLFFKDYATVPVSEDELRTELREAADRAAVERALSRHGIAAHWFPEDRALRGTVHNTKGTTALQSITLTFEAVFDDQGSLVRSEVHGGIVGL
jgi:hypothetical protein